MISSLRGFNIKTVSEFAVLALGILIATICDIAIAQTSPTQAETEQFIKEHYPLCDSRNTGEINESIEISGQRVAMNRSQGGGPDGNRNRSMYVVTIYLTKVRIEGRKGGLSFMCEQAGCSTNSWRPSENDHSPELSCLGERGDRLFKAFQHLQSFTGGPKKSLF